MAFDNGIIFEVNSGGSDSNNGGGFSPACTGFATDLAATSATGTAPVVSSASYNFVSNDVGHFLFVKSGTNWSPGWYAIASVAANAATLTATIGSAVLYNGATSNNIVAGCATTASPTGGTWGVDYSRKTTPGINYTDAVIDPTTNTKFTSLANVVGPNIVGNVMSVTAGTGWTVQRAQVVSVSSITATCDKALGTTSSIAGVAGLGGALATPGKAAGLFVNSSWACIVGGTTYNMTSSSNVAGGRCAPGFGSLYYLGYIPANNNRYPGNMETNRPILQSTGSNGFSLITVGGANTSCHSLDFENGNANTTIKGFDDSSQGDGNSNAWNCKFKGLNVTMDCRTNSSIIFCDFEGTTNTTSGLVADNSVVISDCTFIGCSNLQFSAKSFTNNVVYNCGANSGSGIVGTARYVGRNLFHTITGNTAHACNSCFTHENNIFWNVNGTSSSAIAGTGGLDNTELILNCAFGSNTADVTTGSALPGFQIVNKIVLTADPCTNASGGDFSLNKTAGGGALLRGLGFPVTFANGLTTQSLDVGPAQSVPTAGGGLLVNSQQTGGQQ